MIAFGIVGALLSALFGFIDYFSIQMPEATYRTATRHMLVNLGVGYVPSLIGIVGLAIAGWLGGHLSYVDKIGVAERATGR